MDKLFAWLARHTIELALVVLCIILVWLIFWSPRPAYAAVTPAPPPVPQCADAEVEIPALVATFPDGRVLGEADGYESMRGDRLVILELAGRVWGVLVRKGCMASYPFPIDYAVPRGEPA